jgi:hypothetical protein
VRRGRNRARRPAAHDSWSGSGAPEAGSVNGVLFLTIEDETGFSNVVVWPDLFERQRYVILSADMIAVRGRVQREGAVVHVIAQNLTDLSGLLRSVGDRDEAFRRRAGAAQPGRPAVSVPARRPATNVRMPCFGFTARSEDQGADARLPLNLSPSIGARAWITPRARRSSKPPGSRPGCGRRWRAAASPPPYPNLQKH